MGKKASSAPASPVKVRNKGLQRIRVGDILENPKNYRMHDTMQREAFEGAEKRLGFYGYPDVYETEQGLMLVDGELRTQHLVEKYGSDAVIEVNVTDFNEQEASEALATKDAIAAMALTRGDKLEELLSDIQIESGDKLEKLIGSLRDQAFEARVAELARGGEGDGSDGSDEPTVPVTPPVSGAGYRQLSAMLTDEQHSKVMQAVNSCKETRGLDTTAEALAVISEEWVRLKTRKQAPRDQEDLQATAD